MGLKPERLQQITDAYYADNGSFSDGMIGELIDGINDLRDGFKWIKYAEDDFYNQVEQTELGEMRFLDPRLKPWADQIHSIYGTVSEALNPKY
ncbi:hypothetical protein ACH6EH_07300 [Paenibacillus sp. JSM ZJ436]|uniref:hypothetical protein n=1 Tax=Paenibacillus sp. JSM ZJ436 TaxID=3376190 RepID=UPI0037B725D5